jgi:D-serine deaminase-like pyridoxal phosphate-dependent protein
MRLAELRTPCLVVDTLTLEANLTTMAGALPGGRLRPHVKATKSTALSRRQAELGHRGFCCATVREMEGLAAAGLGDDLLLANEVIDPERLRTAAALDARVTIAVDSPETVDRAAAAGIREVLIDVNVGLPRCGCPVSEAGALAERAVAAGMEVRGVMGYEGQATIAPDPAERRGIVAAAMEQLASAHRDVGGDVVSAGSTVTHAINDVATEIQAGSYALMDSVFAAFPDIPFRPAMWLLTTVISVNADGYAVCDGGLKSLGMDHGNPSIPVDGHEVFIVSDEHVTFAYPPGSPPTIGDRLALLPAHVDPTVAYHDRFHLVPAINPGALDPDTEVIDTWPIDLRGW